MDFVAYHDASNKAINQWAEEINKFAEAGSVPACGLAAIVERESGGDKNAKSGDGGWGLCQITSGVDGDGVYTDTKQNMLDPNANLQVAVRFFLAPAIQQCLLLRERHGDVMARFSEDILYFAFIAYNAGFGTVQQAIANGNDPDQLSTNRYGAGTLALYKRNVSASHAMAPA